ncbi:hypothetical protein [Chitinophaga arvensicola]|uniref:Tail specific protease domain-containing protein n=1 Tax=Chitinophaga arvensicola TaxID=29529 RepID=A0A1I0R4Y0_9BACT|nr:hypothetical protein [Chitinophaga arvensicola]SEW35369.1 hypothetical protein SAMN04488122_2229 [Chitinophaga arvensicola]
MLLRKNYCLLKGIFVLLCMASAYGCNDLRNTAPGGRELPERSKLPDNHFPDLGGDAEFAGKTNSVVAFPFQTSLLTATTAGREQAFTCINLPNTAYDTIAANLIDHYRLLAGTLISRWAEKNTGVVLDLRSNGTNIKQTSYLVSTGAKSFPVVIVWDEAAEDRAARYLKVMEIVPGIQAQGEALVSDNFPDLLPSSEKNKRDKLEDMQPGKYF